MNHKTACQTVTHKVPAGVHIYKSLARCCRYQSVSAHLAQPVFDDGKCVGFAALIEKDPFGNFIYWVK